MNGTLHRLANGSPHRAARLLALWALYLMPRALLILLDVQPWSDAAYYYRARRGAGGGAGLSFARRPADRILAAGLAAWR